MKIGFFGTPEIALACLEYLADRHEICFAVTSADKPQGRSKKDLPSQVKIAALARNIPVLQPESLKDPVFADSLASFGADIFVVVAYGRIIPRCIFEIPRLKTINLHPSLLPKYRGAAPVESAILAGEKFSGITVQYINEKLDAGDILLQENIQLSESMTSGDLFRIVVPRGAEMLDIVVKGLEAGKIQPIPQRESDATYCHKFSREEAKIDWSLSRERIHNLVRAYNPKPVAWSLFRGSFVRIFRTAVSREILPSLLPGELSVFQKRRLFAGTGSEPIEILEIQPEGKKWMDGSSFINGYRITTDRLG
jgi:methionyl-tRNA formyltransferase